MSTVKSCLAQKPTRLISVAPTDPVQRALELMKENRVRSVLVMEGERLAGILSQGDCAIRVLLEGRDARATKVSEIMTANPMTVKPDDHLESCMGLMANRNFRHLPVMDGDKVVVDRSLEPQHNQIVIAVVDGEYTIKRLYRTRACVELRAENPDYQPIVIAADSQLEIWGVVVGVVRRYPA